VFFAHHIAAWLGIPAGAVIVVMLILRKRLGELRVRSKQHRQTATSTTIRPGKIRSRGPAGRERRATENLAPRTRANDTASVRSERT
jgi:hypothetical protein